MFPLLSLAVATLLVAFMARQLRKPSGWFGRRVMASLLNDGNRGLPGTAFAQQANVNPDYNPQTRTPRTLDGFRIYSDRKTRRLLEEAGFTVEIRSPRATERIAVGTKP